MDDVHQVRLEIYIKINKDLTMKVEDYYKRGVEYYQKSNYQAAFNDFNKCISLRKNNPWDFYYRAATSYQLGNYLPALNDIVTCTKLREGNVEPWDYYWTASILIKLDQPVHYRSALVNLTMCIKMRKDKLEAVDFYQRAITHYYLENYDAAIEDMNTCIKLRKSSSAWDSYWLGVFHYRLEKYIQAMGYINNGIKLRNGNPDAWDYYFHGAINSGLENNKEALIDIELGMKLRKTNIESWDYFWRGKINYELGEYQLALNDFALCLQTKKDNSSSNPEITCRFYRGLVFQALKQPQSAQQDFDKVIQLKAIKSNDHYYQGRAYYELGQYQNALIAVNDAIQILKIPRHYYLRAKIYFTLGSDEETMNDCRQALSFQDKHEYKELLEQAIKRQAQQRKEQTQSSKSPQLPTQTSKPSSISNNNNNDNPVKPSFIEQGNALLKQKKYSEAESCFDEGLIENDNNPALWCYKGIAVKAQGRLDDASECFEQALSLKPNHFMTIEEKGLMLIQQHKLTDALQCLEVALKETNAPKTIYLLKALLLRHQKQTTKADEIYQKFSQENDVQILQAHLLLHQKQNIKAELVINKVLKQLPTSSMALQGKGFTELNKNKKESAQTYFSQAEQAAKTNEELAQLFFERGQVYEAWNMKDEARSCYEKALQHQPEHVFSKLCVITPLGTVIKDVPLVQPLAELKISHSQIKLGQQIGKGGFGTVYKGVWQNIEVAIKQLMSDHLSGEAVIEFQHEMQVTAKLRHPNVILLYGAVTEKSPYCLVMEYMSGGSLYSVLHSPVELTWERREQIALDITIGLNYLHHEDLLHRDLKSMNVLLDKYGQAKLCDFGLAKIKKETGNTTKDLGNIAGTLPWMPPELFKDQPNSKASDIYSLGVLFWEVAARKRPLEGVKAEVMPYQILERDELEPIPQETPIKFARLIRFCWQKTPNARPNAAEVIQQLKSSEINQNDFVDNLASQRSNENDSYLDNLASQKNMEEFQNNFQSTNFGLGKKS